MQLWLLLQGLMAPQLELQEEVEEEGLTLNNQICLCRCTCSIHTSMQPPCNKLCKSKHLPNMQQQHPHNKMAKQILISQVQDLPMGTMAHWEETKEMLLQQGWLCFHQPLQHPPSNGLV